MGQGLRTDLERLDAASEVGRLNTDKLAAMREAMNDSLFLADLREIASDFSELEVKR